MARSPHSFSGAHVLAWSSPLLLLVLLFTVTSRTPPATTSGAASTVGPTTTSRPSPTTTGRPAVPPTRPPATTSEPRSSVATASNGRSPASALSESVASGSLEGTLSAGFAVAVVPLQGPGTWTLGGSSTISALLDCPSVSGPVVGVVVIADRQSCQLELTSTNVEASPTWQLTPAH